MTFRARYDGRCGGCGEVIEAGDTLEWSDAGQAVHESCALEEIAAAARIRETCPRCFIELPLIGVCGVCE